MEDLLPRAEDDAARAAADAAVRATEPPPSRAAAAACADADDGRRDARDGGGTVVLPPGGCDEDIGSLENVTCLSPPPPPPPPPRPVAAEAGRSRPAEDGRAGGTRPLLMLFGHSCALVRVRGGVMFAEMQCQKTNLFFFVAAPKKESPKKLSKKEGSIIFPVERTKV